MAKRDIGKQKKTDAAKTPPEANAANTTDAMEQRVVAFAEQLGRMVGTVQAKTEGWMDRDALNKQIASVRDSAAELLEQLKTSVTSATAGLTSAEQKAAPAPQNSKGRSGGVVDAPGKKHRKPTPRDSRAQTAGAKASSMRAGKASMKTMKQRGRG